MALLIKFTYRHQSLEVFQLGVFGTQVVVKAMLLVNCSEDFRFCDLKQSDCSSPILQWVNGEDTGPNCCQSICVSFWSWRWGSTLSASSGLHAPCLSIKWNRRARGCAWDLKPAGEEIILDARTQNRKCIQMLHFRKDTNILIYVLLLFSILSF